MDSQHLLACGRSLRPVYTFISIIISSVFEFYDLQTADMQPPPACICPRCHYTQGEVRRWESYFHIENVLLRNNRPPAAVSGQTQVRPRPPVLTVSLQHETLPSCVSCITEGVVSLHMTSSVRTHSAATMTTARRSNHVDSRLTLLCCCERGNAHIH